MPLDPNTPDGFFYTMEWLQADVYNATIPTPDAWFPNTASPNGVNAWRRLSLGAAGTDPYFDTENVVIVDDVRYSQMLFIHK